MMRYLFASLIFTLVSSSAFAAGYILNEQGAAATGRGGAVVATPQNGSTIFFNPGGITQLNGFQMYVGSQVIFPSASFTSKATGETTDVVSNTAIVPNGYVTYQFDNVEFGNVKNLTLGIGVFNPFGLRTEWPESSPGRQIARTSELRAPFISPVVGAEIMPGLSIGAGADIVPASARLSRDILFGAEGAGAVNFRGSTLGFGGRIGVFYETPVEGLNLGLAYRSPVKLKLDGGQVDFDAPEQFRNQLPADSEEGGSAELTLPQSVLFGTSYNVTPAFNVALDINWIGWSAFDELRLEFDGLSSAAPRDWKNTWVVRLGTEYSFGNVAIRAGYIFDQTPVPEETLDFTLPDGNRHDVTAGLGFDVTDTITVDASMLIVLPLSRDTADGPSPPVKGTFDVSVFLATLGVGVKFGTPEPAPMNPAPVVESTTDDTAAETLEPAPTTADDTATETSAQDSASADNPE